MSKVEITIPPQFSEIIEKAAENEAAPNELVMSASDQNEFLIE